MSEEVRSVGRKRPALLPFQWLGVLLLQLLLGLVAAGVFWAAARNESVHDTYYVVAHFNASFLIAPAVFGLYYAFSEKMTGLRYRPVLGQLHFFTFFAGSMLVLAPSLSIGVFGLPDRYTDYPASFAFWNTVSTVEFGLLAVSLLIFGIVIVDSLVRRVRG